MWYHRRTVQTLLGTFEEEGAGWMCYHEYGHGDVALHTDDCNGSPDETRMACLEALIPQLSAHEAECRRRLACIDAHDLSGVFFETGCDFVLAFNWGNGEWGRSVFVKMASGKVINTQIISD